MSDLVRRALLTLRGRWRVTVCRWCGAIIPDDFRELHAVWHDHGARR